MDDQAASQQLMHEAHAEHLIGDGASFVVNGSEDAPSSEGKKRKRHSAHKSLKERPDSSPPIDSHTQTHADSHVDAAAPAVQIPDSQTLAHTTSTPMSPQVVSSSFVPASLIKSKRTYKKNRRSIQLEPSDIEAAQNKDRDEDAASSSHKPSKRRRSRKSSTEPESPKQLELEIAQDTNAGQAQEYVGDEVAATSTPAKRERKFKPKRASQVDHQNQHDDESTQPPEKKRRKKEKSRSRRSDAEAALNEVALDDELSTTNAETDAAEVNGDRHFEADGVVSSAIAKSTPIPTEAATNGQDFDDTSTRKDHDKTEEQQKHLEIPESSPVSDHQPDQPLEEPANDTERAKHDGDDDPYDIHTVPKYGNDYREDIYSIPESGDDDAYNVHAEPQSSSNEGDVHHKRSVQTNSSSKKTRKKKSRPSDTPSKKARRQRKEGGLPTRIRKSQNNSTNVVSSVERALNMNHDLNVPPVLRREGEFSKDEEELIRRAIKDYRDRKGLENSELVDVIQWTTDDVDRTNVHNKSDWTPREKEDASESAEFWAEMKLINLTRKFDIIRRHIRTQYHQYKSGGWTDEEDEQLRNLHELYPTRWKFISTSMGDRSMHDCQNRWRDYLQYGNKRNVATWSKDEEELLVRAVNTVAQRDEDARAEAGRPPLDEYTGKDISWPQVSREMGGIRSRIQASVKWSGMKNRSNPPRIQLEYKPRKEVVQSVTPTPKKRGRPRKESGQPSVTPTPRKRGRPRKSEIGGEEQPKKRRKQEESQGAASDSAQEEEVKPGEESQSEVPDPVQEKEVQPESVDSMLWGDKFDLLLAIADRRDDSQEDIDWDDIAKAQNHPWSTETLRTALQGLIQLARDSGKDVDEEDFPGTIDDIIDFISSEHAGELEEHYDPEKVAPKDDVQTGNSLAATPLSLKKKKKQRMSEAEMEASMNPKSQEIISDSDDAGSEPEM
jgi:hypothetical protein